MKQLTKEKAIAYFNERAPKALREKGIETIEEYFFRNPENKDDEGTTLFVINKVYMIRYIIPEAFNCFMRNQRFKPTLRGCKAIGTSPIKRLIKVWTERGWLREVR